MRYLPLLLLGVFLAACGERDDATTAPADLFMDNLRDLCGQAFAGEMVSDHEMDADFAGQSMVMHVRECTEDEIRIPFHIGEDRSRTWIVTRTAEGLRLKHDHRHEDGSEDTVTMYGGDTAAPGTATRQDFPVDAFSGEMFAREGLATGLNRVWTIEIAPGETFAYQLGRDNRVFQVEFDLTAPMDPPPAPWGHE